MATRKSKYSDDQFVRALDPRYPDTQYLGVEPSFSVQPKDENRKIVLSKSFTWYNRFYGKKQAKELLCQYLDHNNRIDEAKKLRKIHENQFPLTYSWLSRMTLRGFVLSETEQERLEKEIKLLTEIKENPESIVVEIETVRPTIQDRLLEKTSEASSELEGLFDEFMTTGKVSSKTVDIVAKFNITPQHIPLIVEIWKKKAKEFEELSEGKDKDLNEAYKHLGKIQVRNVVKFIDGVLGDLNSYISIKKASKTPRKRKAVPVEKIVAKLKYLKEFKDPANKLDLVSVHPTKLHGASEAWVYDTAKRKIHHYIADEYSKTFTVKGNTILGFDSNASEVKTLRKPGDALKEIMGSKPAARKYFKEIKAVSTIPNGRFNENMIILRAF
jgi:hypothetical protein